MNELEKKLADAAPEATSRRAMGHDDAEQAKELSRITIKAERCWKDNVADQGRA